MSLQTHRARSPNREDQHESRFKEGSARMPITCGVPFTTGLTKSLFWLFGTARAAWNSEAAKSIDIMMKPKLRRFLGIDVLKIRVKKTRNRGIVMMISSLYNTY